ncbi:MAG TPA: hypothetical protein VJ476_03830, partial [Rhizomicrobium sp.]|nr:hypothetical protein [Rhizomicrobium sp.]
KFFAFSLGSMSPSCVAKPAGSLKGHVGTGSIYLDFQKEKSTPSISERIAPGGAAGPRPSVGKPSKQASGFESPSRGDG